MLLSLLLAWHALPRWSPLLLWLHGWHSTEDHVTSLTLGFISIFWICIPSGSSDTSNATQNTQLHTFLDITDLTKFWFQSTNIDSIF